MPDYIVYWKTVSCGQFLMKNFLKSTWAFLKKKDSLENGECGRIPECGPWSFPHGFVTITESLSSNFIIYKNLLVCNRRGYQSSTSPVQRIVMVERRLLISSSVNETFSVENWRIFNKRSFWNHNWTDILYSQRSQEGQPKEAGQPFPVVTAIQTS